MSSINRVRYAGFDFDTHVDDLRARLQIKFAADYNDFALASLGMMLLDIIAFGLDTLSFYLDRRATEVYLSTARTRRAVARISRQLGYKMGGAVSSSTDLNISIDNPQAFSIPLVQGFQFNGPNDLIFEVGKEVTWSPAEQTAGTIKQVPIYEGETIVETFTSDGSANQVFELRRVPDDRYVAAGSVEVVVDGADWEEVDFIDFEQTDQFEVGYNDDPATVRFGDSVAGNIPATNASITVTYVVCAGQLGNVTAGTIEEVTTELVISGTSISLTIEQPNKTRGGDNLEAVDRAKSFAGRVFNSRRVAITRPDYEALAGSFADPLYGRVSVAQALSPRSAENDLTLKALLLLVESSLETPVATIRSEIATNASDTDHTLEQMLDDTDDISTQLGEVGTNVSSISSNADAVITGIRGNRNLTLDVDSEANAAAADINGFPTASPSQLTSGDAATLIAYLDSIKSKTALIRSAADTQVAAGGVIKDEVDKIGTSTTALRLDGSDSNLKAIEDARANVVALIGAYDATTPADSTGLYLSYRVTLEGAADTLDPSLTGNSAAVIANALEEIEAHVDKILSADCKANLVSVPILVKDSAGFYTGPSNGLVGALQDYLDARKEVTQTVSVVSGESFLVYPWVTVRIGILAGYSLEKTRVAVEAVIDGVLKDRLFGISLYVSDLSKPIGAVEGVGFVNVTIDGYTTALTSTVQTDKLDTDGNLIIETREVITKTPGSITVTPEAHTVLIDTLG